MKKILLLFGLLIPLSSLCAKQNPIVIGNKRITLISPTLFRLEYAYNGEFLDEKSLFAYNRNVEFHDFELRKIDDDNYEITTAAVRMQIHDDGFPFGLYNFKAWFQLNEKETQFNLRGRQTQNLGGAISTLDRVSGPIPLNEGLLSRDGWYIVNDSGKDILKDGWLALRNRNHIQDIYCFVYGNNYKAALADLGRISGNVPMTRRHVHGIWYCRWWDYTADEYRKIVQGYNENRFPLDNLVFDMGWHTQDAMVGTGHARSRGWTGYSWNEKLIPNPEKLIAEFAEDHIYVSLNDHPHDGIRPHEHMYHDFMKDMGAEADGSTILFDAGDPKYMKAFFKHAHKRSWDMGIAFWWLDWQQNYLYPVVRGTTTSHLSWLNELYYKESERNGLRGANYSRWAGWGDHRHPIQFSGDSYANWDMLAFEVELTATSGNAGCYYWAHDIGGFYGGRDPELYARWTQFGAVSAAMRIHSQYDADLDRRPWLWGNLATESMRQAYYLRAQLMPYIYSSVWQTHKTMIPLNRPMYLDYGQDSRAYACPAQFMYGDLMLAAPITTPGSGENKIASQKVWFPGSGRWYDFFTGELHRGGEEKTISKDINEFPLFVRGGWILPMQPYHPRPASAPLETLIMRVWQGDEGTETRYLLYEDDGLTRKYENGQYSITSLGYKRDGDRITLTVEPDNGMFDGKVKKRSYRIELPALKGISDIDTHGHPADILNEAGMYIVNIAACNSSEKITVELSISE